MYWFPWQQEHEKGLKDAEHEQDNMSSLVWICTTTHNSSRVTVIDANNPADVLETFHVTSSHILCIASVPGKVSPMLHTKITPVLSGQVVNMVS